MAANYHHGPEILEIREAESYIRDVKSSVTMLVGTAPVHLAHDDAEKRAAYINKRIVIRSVKDAVAAFGPDTAGYSILQAVNAMFNKAINGQSGGTIIVVNVFDPDKHKDEGGQPDPSKVTAADIIGAVDAAGNYSGFQLAYGAYNTLGYFPKVLIAPGFTTLPGVRAAMDVLANKIHAIALDDLPLGLTVQQAVEQRGVGGDYNTSSERAVLLYPHVKALDGITGDITLQPYSQHYAGVLIASDLAYGYWHSPSNREMADVLGIERDISFLPGEYGFGRADRRDGDWLGGRERLRQRHQMGGRAVAMARQERDLVPESGQGSAGAAVPARASVDRRGTVQHPRRRGSASA